LYVVVTEEPSNGYSVLCHGNGLTANGVSKHVASATVDAIHRTPPPSKRFLFFVYYVGWDVKLCSLTHSLQLCQT